MDIEMSNTSVVIDKKSGKKEPELERANWSNGVEFLMSCISLSVGLGNVWRFPFTAYENGGGAFLVPYIIVLFFIGKPMYYLEMALGQFTSKSSIKVWCICPSFKGVGYGQALGTACIITYYSSLLALCLYYFNISFYSVLPWTVCRPEWGPGCVGSSFNSTQPPLNSSIKLQSSSELYFLKHVIKEADDISSGIGLPDWPLTVNLFIAWVCIFLLIIKGIQSSGKMAYFLALFPYVVMITILIKAATLEGALNGIKFFFKPSWESLLNFKVWKEAVTQCFFSLAVGLGPLIMLSSYNRFDHNIYRDVMVVTTLDTVTSLLAGSTIFSILGNLAHNLNEPDIGKVVKGGAGIAFVSYPDAIANFQALPQFFSALFFFMLFVLGLGSIVALQNCIATILCDQFKNLQYWKISAAICAIGFLLSIIYVTPGGQWLLSIVDFYAGTLPIFFLGIMEIIGVSWIYGLQNFCDDIEFMTKKKVSLYWRICWAFFTPVMMIVIFVYSMIKFEPLQYGGKYFPDAAHVAGWVLFSIAVAQFPLWFFWHISRSFENNFITTLKKSFMASSEWGPHAETDRAQWLVFKKDRADKRRQRVESKKLNMFWQQIYNALGF